MKYYEIKGLVPVTSGYPKKVNVLIEADNLHEAIEVAENEYQQIEIFFISSRLNYEIIHAD